MEERFTFYDIKIFVLLNLSIYQSFKLLIMKQKIISFHIID